MTSETRQTNLDWGPKSELEAEKKHAQHNHAQGDAKGVREGHPASEEDCAQKAKSGNFSFQEESRAHRRQGRNYFRRESKCAEIGRLEFLFLTCQFNAGYQ